MALRWMRSEIISATTHLPEGDLLVERERSAVYLQLRQRKSPEHLGEWYGLQLRGRHGVRQGALGLATLVAGEAFTRFLRVNFYLL